MIELFLSLIDQNIFNQFLADYLDYSRIRKWIGKINEDTDAKAQ